MRSNLRIRPLARYRYPEPTGTNYFERELRRSDLVTELFGCARYGRAEVSAEGWKFLWTQWGLQGLLEINRVGGWFVAESDEAVAGQLVEQSLADGYDPVSGLLVEEIVSIAG